MSLKAELETWANALKAYDEGDYEKSLDQFSRIADSSKILTNMGLIYATLGEHETAVENFNAATSLDQYLAVAYFQCGVSNFLITRYELALKDFEEALLYLRGNQAINYEQLGLKFKLYSAEVLFNLGLSKVYLGRFNEGMQDMQEATQEKATEEHNVIDDAIQDRGDGYTVFSIPVGVLYRPDENKLKNAGTKDYLGKAKLVAAADERDTFTTFTGSTRLRQGITPTGVYIDRPASDPSSDRPPATRAEPPDAPPKASVLRKGTSTSRLGRDGYPEGDGPIRPTTPGNQFAGPTRGLSVRTPGSGPGPGTGPGPSIGLGPGMGPGPSMGRSPSARSPSRGRSPQGPGPNPAGKRDELDPQNSEALRKANNSSRLTEIYDEYIDQYAEEPPEVPPLPGQDGKSRVAAWARNNANPAARRGPAASTYGGPPPSAYAPSSSGLGYRRKLSRRPTGRSTGSGTRSTMYEEEEEGYVSGDYEDAPFELVKIRVKLHYRDDVRGMALTPEMPFEEFIYRVTQKFKRPVDGLELKFKDEDGVKVSLRDDSDYDLAIETARESARGKPEGKLEIWCADQ